MRPPVSASLLHPQLATAATVPPPAAAPGVVPTMPPAPLHPGGGMPVAQAPRDKYKGLRRFDNTPARKASSTSTLITTNSISRPEELLRSVCIKVREMIEVGLQMGHPVLPIMFSEDYHPLNIPNLPRHSGVPATDEIYLFMNGIVKKLELNPICHVMCLAYLERLNQGGRRLTLHPSTWRRTIMSAIMLAGKVFHDEAPWNVDLSDSFPWITLAEINKMELLMLQLMTFDVTLTPQQYAQYYFMLRELNRDQLPEQPLGAAELEQLHQATARQENVLKQRHGVSTDTGLHMSHAPAIIN
eukprot:GAFH01002667.1.p2 GENE.GAFH01002667.1~~GAFH01002667.1.p2  ORF type:complete len:320 (+),score=72.01 GAFH01002667.1:63-962(+)